LSKEGILLHATCVAIGGHGVLIMGPPGSGKSDLALRLIDGAGCGIGTELLTAKLVSDDQTMVMRRGDRLIGSAPEAIAGKLEIRGLGIVELQYQAESELSLAVTLTPEIERMPVAAEQACDICGVRLSAVSIEPESPSAPARIRAALGHLVER